MATLGRKSSATYKDYVSFVDAYKKDSTTGSSSASSSTSDVTDFTKTNNCVSYKSYQEKSQTKKFSSVRPVNLEKPPTKRSEIFIEIQPTNHVTEATKIFEHNPHKEEASKTIRQAINLFESQKSNEKKPSIVTPKIHQLTIPVSKEVSSTETMSPPPQRTRPSPKIEVKSEPIHSKTDQFVPPPPPLPPQLAATPKIQVTINYNNNNSSSQPIAKNQENSSTKLSQLDRNDPMVRKLVYGTLRGMCDMYHSQANDIMATLPRNRVRKDNGIHRIINEITLNGDLDKLNGRTNPKQDV